MSKPAARLGDLTNHPGSIIGGSQNVLIKGQPAARMQDPHQCGMPPPGGPHPPNPIVMGSTTVLINNRMATTLTNTTGCGAQILPPCATTVLIGGPYISATALYGGATVLRGPPQNIRQLADILNNIAESGADGLAQIQDLNSAARPTELNIETGVTPHGDSVANSGGGLCYNVGDHNEIYVDPNTLITYRADTDPVGVETGQESPEGLVSHEIGHAQCENESAPSHSQPYPAADNDVINRTNPIRDDLGLSREHLR